MGVGGIYFFIKLFSEVLEMLVKFVCDKCDREVIKEILKDDEEIRKNWVVDGRVRWNFKSGWKCMRCGEERIVMLYVSNERLEEIMESYGYVEKRGWRKI